MVGGNASGGCSGGGSINIFALKGDSVSATGTVSGGTNDKGGAGGSGTITKGSVVSGTFIPL